MLSFRHKTGSCHKTTSSANPFTATKLDISLVFSQVQLVLMNALQLWKVSERISSCFVGISDETFHVWSIETPTQQRLGKPKHKRKVHWGLCTHTQDPRCVGCFKAQGGQGSGLAKRAKISWGKTQTLDTALGETTEPRLPRTQCTNWTLHTHYHHPKIIISKSRVEDLSLDLIATTVHEASQD